MFFLPLDPGYFIMGGRWDQTRWDDGNNTISTPPSASSASSTSTSASASASASGDGDDDDNRPFPTAADLDRFFPVLPLVLMRVDYHAVWVNSAAMRIIGDIPDTDPDGGEIIRDKDGKPTGIFLDNAMRLFTWNSYAKVPKEVQMDAIKTAIKECNRNGVTTVHDALVLDTGTQGIHNI
jgi:predicted amidohydrolase YtcJ